MTKMLRTRLFAVLLMAPIAAGADKTQHTYQQGTITGWSTQHFSATVPMGGGVMPVPRHKKFYELKGAGITYQIDDCGSFGAGQAVDYRVQGNKVYITQGERERAQVPYRGS
jgi:hypothetical protein